MSEMIASLSVFATQLFSCRHELGTKTENAADEWHRQRRDVCGYMVAYSCCSSHCVHRHRSITRARCPTTVQAKLKIGLSLITAAQQSITLNIYV